MISDSSTKIMFQSLIAMISKVGLPMSNQFFSIPSPLPLKLTSVTLIHHEFRLQDNGIDDAIHRPTHGPARYVGCSSSRSKRI